MSLLAPLIASLERSAEPISPADIAARSFIALGPNSSLGLSKLKPLVQAGARFEWAVDDYCTASHIEGIPVITSAQLLERAKRLPADVVAIDFTQSSYSTGYFKALTERAGIELRDLLQAQACFDTVGVYESVRTYRARTIARADDWLKFAQRLADDRSRETLYAVLLQRLEHDRNWAADIRLDGRDEYFGNADSNTFILGHQEHFVDCGAHRGTVLHKLLGITS